MNLTMCVTVELEISGISTDEQLSLSVDIPEIFNQTVTLMDKFIWSNT
jgi:hypothetical protein